jgi:hypothetical protein
MNDTITPSPEQAALEARIAELKTYAGKTFRRKDGRGGLIKVIGYHGIGRRSEIRNGVAVAVREHVFEAIGNGSHWTPPATKFLEEHEQVEVKPETETSTVE